MAISRINIGVIFYRVKILPIISHHLFDWRKELYLNVFKFAFLDVAIVTLFIELKLYLQMVDNAN